MAKKVTEHLLAELEHKAALKSGSIFETKLIGVHNTSGDLLYVMDVDGTKVESETFDVKICDVFMPIFDKAKRIVSARGGRGSAKSNAFAIYLVLLGAKYKLRILCFRETQTSIKDSVYALLKEIVAQCGLNHFYEFTREEIRGKNGTIFIFKGLSDMTADSIKSIQGIDIAWGEEAAALTESSLKTFIPSIRNDNARIFFSWNPELDTDAVYQRYVINPPEDVASFAVNYNDNPWFPSILDKARMDDEARISKPEYENIWLGKVLPAKSGAVYYAELDLMFSEDPPRITKVPYRPNLPVHQFWDLGTADHNAIILVQKTPVGVFIIDHYENNRKNLQHYNEWLHSLPYKNWGTMYLPHDGARDDIRGETVEKQMQDMGWKVEIVPSYPGAVDDGIRASRRMMEYTYIDATKCTRLIECLKRYHYKERKDGSLSSLVHDASSHSADAFRYLGFMHEQIRNDNNKWGSKALPSRNNTVFGNNK